MTKEQAITRIKHSSMYIDDKETADYIIKALEQPTMDKAMIHILTKENDEFVTPTHGTCKNCKHWKDSDGVYRRGINAESKCPLNILQVFDGDFYCADFEKRGNENGN